jgi:hypothetical protein
MPAPRLLCAALALLPSACARYQHVSVYSQPSDAEVYLDKQLVGRTPLELRLDRNDAHAIYVKRTGYRPELVILELVRAPDGIDFLTPPDVEVRLVPGRASSDTDRDLEIEAEPEAR